MAVGGSSSEGFDPGNIGSGDFCDRRSPCSVSLFVLVAFPFCSVGGSVCGVAIFSGIGVWDFCVLWGKRLGGVFSFVGVLGWEDVALALYCFGHSFHLFCSPWYFVVLYFVFFSVSFRFLAGFYISCLLLSFS